MNKLTNEAAMMDNSMEQEDAPIWVTEFDIAKSVEFCNAIFGASQRNPNKPILVYINSYGGDVGGLLAMTAAMDAVPNKIVTVAMGYALSAGCILLAHGDIRFASPTSRIMLHKIQSGVTGGLDDIMNDAEEISRVNHAMFSMFAADVGKPVEDVEKSVQIKRDLYFSAEEAKTYGIVDMVGVPTVETGISYNIGVYAPPEVKPAEAPQKAKKKKKAKK